MAKRKTLKQVARDYKVIAAEAARDARDTSRYCDGLSRGATEALKMAKEAFGRGEDEVAKALRLLSMELNLSIQEVQNEYDARMKTLSVSPR